MSRIGCFDSARGLASIAVVFGHFLLAFDLYGAVRWIHYSPLHIVYDGFAAVSFFFVLSGFILSLKYFNSPCKRFDLFTYISYAVKRVLRIYPLYIFIIVISLLLKVHFFTKIETTPSLSLWLQSMWTEAASFSYFFSKFYFIPRRSSFVPQAWTLGIELLFSLFVPFVVLAVKRNVLVTVFIISCSVFYTTTGVFAFHFLTGIMLACYFEKIRKIMDTFSRGSKLTFLAASVGLYTIRHTFPEYLSILGVTNIFIENDKFIWIITGIGASGILASIANSEILNKILNHKWLLFAGKISYSLYLCHMIIFVLIMPKIINFLNLNFGINSPFIVIVTSFISVITLIFIFSWGSHRLIEKPFIQLGKIFGNFVNARSRSNPDLL
ncbi:MAG: acyltransferase [Chlorobium sp.]|nr:acyltransferase [Chlorobium sp.]